MTRALSLTVAALALAAWLGGCATAPATGRTIFTGGLSEEREAALGFQENQKILDAFGGAYQDPALARYIDSLGQLLVRTSELPDQTFTFTVLDTPMVNAMALPGGYVYVTRGLLALAGNEAEVAGVLAHEIGHVTARHAAERYGQSMAASLLNVGARVLLGGGPETQALGVLSGIVLRGYSREQESEADRLAVRYLSRSGHDPWAMVGFLEKLQANSRFEAELRGHPGKADEFDIMQTHPRTADRIAQAIEIADAAGVDDPIVGGDVYLQQIDGLRYGESPEQGLIRDRHFAHPKLRFAFTVPPGFTLFNSARRVSALGPEGAAILFDRAPRPSSASMTGYLQRDWASAVRLREVEAISIDGLEAATGWARLSSQRGPVDVRLVAIRFDAGTIYRFVFVTPPALTAQLAPGLKRTTYSFRRLSEAEAAELRPLRLQVVTVQPGETSADLARRMAFEERALERFQVLNGLAPGAAPASGRQVKIVSE